ncbi:MAG: MoaD/ThiS family protein, partial [Anaerolineae bacterium]
AEHDAQAGYVHKVVRGAAVAEVLPDLPFLSTEVYTFFVNGRHAERDQTLQNGDILSVFPAAGGG